MINFKIQKGKNISQDLSQLFSLQQWYYPFASLFFHRIFLCIHHVIIYRNCVFLSNILVVMTLENAKLYDKMSVSKTFTV